MIQDRGCRRTVPDHTDLVPCGEPVLRAGYCSTHLQAQVQVVRARIADHEEALGQLRRELDSLQTESG